MPSSLHPSFQKFFFFRIVRVIGVFFLLIYARSLPMVSSSPLSRNLFVPPKPSLFGVTNISGLRFLTQLRVDLNDLRVHRFRHGFANCPSPLCACGTGNESTSHFLHLCPRFSSQRSDLYSKIRSLDSGNSLLSLSHDDLTSALLYGVKKLTATDNKFILESTIDFIHKSKRFSKLEAFA